MSDYKNFTEVGVGQGVDLIKDQAVPWSVAGTFVADVLLEYSIDSGANWVLNQSMSGGATGTFDMAVWLPGVAGARLRFNVPFYTSGTVETFITSPYTRDIPVIAPAQDHTLPDFPQSVRLTDGSAFYKAATEVTLAVLAAKDFATETTLALVKGVLDLIKAKTDNLDVLLSTRTKPDDVQQTFPQPQASGGYTVFHRVSTATTNATVVKASPGQVYGWRVYNNVGSAPRKLVFHDSATLPTAGAGVYFVVVVPPDGEATLMLPAGIPFSDGIGITMVVGMADSNATAVSSEALLLTLFYK